MDPEGEMKHQSDGKKAAIEEEENCGQLKDDEMEFEMEVDADESRGESAEIQRGDTSRIRRNSRLCL